MNDPKNVPGSRASTKIKWIRLENLLPQDVAKSMKGVREACVSMELPVVYSGRRNPSQDGNELFLSYGFDHGNAYGGLTDGRDSDSLREAVSRMPAAFPEPHASRVP